MRYWVLPSVDSTQLQARRCLDQYGLEASGLVIWARQQTHGVGQQGRPWVSALGGIYMTVMQSVPTARLMHAPTQVPERVATACQFVLDGYVRAWVKPPNDIMVGDRKLGGVLCESLGTEDPGTRMLFIGVGLNINQESVVTDARHVATSLRQETGQSYNEAMIVSAIATEIMQCL